MDAEFDIDSPDIFLSLHVERPSRRFWKNVLGDVQKETWIYFRRMKRLFWKCVFFLYALFTAFDLFSLPSRPFFPTGAGSILGVVTAVAMAGYAFRIRIGSARLWQILFVLQLLGIAIALGALIKMHTLTGGVRREFSPFILLVLPVSFLIMYPWFRYAFRSPEIWEHPLNVKESK